jgi:hypothetical protein
MKRAWVAAVACVLASAAAGGCDDQAPAVQCRNIPDGGCPTQGGVACDDPACAAAYTCGADGGWILDHVCPPQDAAAPDAGLDAPSPSDAGYDIDAPPGAFGGPGCVTLQPPDCPLGTALVCSSGCCGCEDLFVCDDGGWNPWGTCTDAGVTKL